MIEINIIKSEKIVQSLDDTKRILETQLKRYENVSSKRTCPEIDKNMNDVHAKIIKELKKECDATGQLTETFKKIIESYKRTEENVCSVKIIDRKRSRVELVELADIHSKLQDLQINFK